MKNPMRSTFVVVALVGATTGLAACGDDEPETAAAPSTPAEAVQQTSIPTTPPPEIAPEKAAWAKKYCAALAPGNKEVTPPNVQGTTPEDTKTSIITFFTTVANQQKLQMDAIDKVGAPPGANSKRDWREASQKLEDINGQVTKLVKDTESREVESPEDVEALVTQLGKTLKDFGNYQGVIADLAASKGIGDAIKADAGCGALL